MRWVVVLAVAMLTGCGGEPPPDPRFVPDAWTVVNQPYDETSQACALLATQQLRVGMAVEPTATRVQRTSNTWQASHRDAPAMRLIELDAMVGQVPAKWRFGCVSDFNGQRRLTGVERI